MKVAILDKQGNVIAEGHPADMREIVEDKICEKLGFYPSLQESDLEDEEEYFIYLHTDSYEELSDEQLAELDRLKITENPEETMCSIKKLFEIDFRVIR